MPSGVVTTKTKPKTNQKNLTLNLTLKKFRVRARVSVSFRDSFSWFSVYSAGQKYHWLIFLVILVVT